jgi:NAD-dependent dihydropyrimidine dehydrogenase PreA subunit
MKAISVYMGLFAVVKGEKCVGCGKCERACPAAVIAIIDREAA